MSVANRSRSVGDKTRTTWAKISWTVVSITIPPDLDFSAIYPTN
ncbi:hypothetical protein [Aphanothece hegewaldii]|nr:hypothetical protein [Aphanothece hegewaldii]